jgi:hypothetical protein
VEEHCSWQEKSILKRKLKKLFSMQRNTDGVLRLAEATHGGRFIVRIMTRLVVVVNFALQVSGALPEAQ